MVSTSSWSPLRVPVAVDLSQAAGGTGYRQVQLRNAGSWPVYFDSLTIRHPQEVALVTQEAHYYPFGMALSGVAVNTAAAAQPSKSQFNGGSALQDELLGSEAGLYSTFYRSYDPATGRFQGVDPLAEKYADNSPYSFALNDPVNLNDPDGAEPYQLPKTYAEAVNQMYGSGWYEQNGRGGTNAAFYGSSAFGVAGGANLPGQTIGGDYYTSTAYANWLAAYANDHSPNKRLAFDTQHGQFGWFEPYGWAGERGSGTKLGEVTVGMKFTAVCMDCVDPTTVGKNFLGLTYPGGDNPKNFAGADTYAYTPESLTEYPAIGHDRRYDNLHVKGSSGLLFSPKSIGADWRFVVEEYGVAAISFWQGDFKTYGQAMFLGTGLGVAATFKTALVLSIGGVVGIGFVSYWDGVANQDVSNNPAVHKH